MKAGLTLPNMAHLFQENMLPMVEAKMIARIIQQIMIIIFFCSSGEKKAHEKHQCVGRVLRAGAQQIVDVGEGLKEKECQEEKGDGSGF